jgi:DNA modification methylase
MTTEAAPVEFLAREVREVPIDSLVPHPMNPNVGSLDAIEESVDEVGSYSVIFAQQATSRILAGEHRWRTLQRKGATTAPVVYLDVDDAQALRILLADNEIPRRHSRPDERAMAAALQALAEQTGHLRGTGYDVKAQAALLAAIAEQNSGDAADADIDDAPPVLTAPQRVTRGDIWALGPHRLMCGDCRNPSDVDRLLAGVTLNLAVTSPPYADRRKYDETSDFQPIAPEDYVEWFAPVSANVARHLAEDGSWLVNIRGGADGLDRETYVLDLVLAHARDWGWRWAEEFCWERVGVPKQPVLRLKNQYEPIYQFTRGRWKFRPDNVTHYSENVPIAGGPGVGDTGWATDQGQSGVSIFGGERRNDMKRRKHGGAGGWGGAAGGDDIQGTNWAPGAWIGPGMAYPGNRLPTFSGSHEATGHTAAYPVGLPSFLIRLFTDISDAIFDPFVGSGSSLLAAHQEGRVGYGMEISPAYCDVVIHRWERHTGTPAERVDQAAAEA